MSMDAKTQKRVDVAKRKARTGAETICHVLFDHLFHSILLFLYAFWFFSSLVYYFQIYN